MDDVNKKKKKVSLYNLQPHLLTYLLTQVEFPLLLRQLAFDRRMHMLRDMKDLKLPLHQSRSQSDPLGRLRRSQHVPLFVK